MLLTQLHKGDQAEITKIHADQALKNRFSSFGIMPGEILTVKACSIAKQTMEIEVGSTHIALRAQEAEKIEVNKH
ncbi:MAG: ferrous iron transport protein A [Campylobacterales bacterium]|nr:ferrous iron transport protein A [Campylobacterales bacterium]